MKTIVHQYDVDSDIHVGGIDTWISDYLEFSSNTVRVIGVSARTGKIPNRHELFSIMGKSSKKVIPISLKFAFRIMLSRRLLTQEIYVHRIDYVPIIRVVRPLSKLILFLHTDSLMHTKKNSDSTWKFFPRLYFMYERFALLLSSRVYVYSENDLARIQGIKKSARQLKAWYNDRIFRESGIPRNPDAFLWVGRFEHPKDPLLAIRAFAAATQISPCLKLNMIGEGSLNQEMIREIDRLGLSERIRISGPKNQTDLALEMNMSGALIHTSVFEGSPRVLLEALACGMRIVSNSSADPDKLSVKFGICSATRLKEDVANSVLLACQSAPNILELRLFLSQVAGSNVVGRDFG